ncbi:MAG: ATP-binding cassette domain-containing protein, partial [Trueperaceae bacterium]|nr:ATP-binding cassette domain-containing protein [Trueperaceae bacterium]
LDEARRDAPTTRFTFPCPASVDLVLHAEHLAARYAHPLFEDVALVVRQGERVAITGPNGAGKTTFLRVLLGERPSDDPRARIAWGSRVRVAYYDQDLAGVDPDATLFAELHRLVGDARAHDLLGRFLFPYEAQFKRIGDLSGGERARLALLKLTLSEANVLVLDEPTNHLDVEMIEALEAALRAYEGTVLFVSHDRRFLAALATRVWEVADGRLVDYEGDWAFFGRKQAERRRSEAADDAAAVGPEAPAEPSAPKGPSPWQLRRERERIEAEVARLEEALASAVAAIEAATAEVAAGRLAAEALVDLGRRHDASEAALLEAMAAWEATVAALDERTAEAGGGVALGEGR